MEQKNKIAVIALIFALLAMVGQVGINGINGTNGTNAAGGEIAYYLHNTSSDITNSKVMNASLVPTPLTSYVNVTNVPNGDTLLMNWTTPGMNITSMPAGVHILHITVAKTSTGGAHDDYIYYKCASVNSTGALIMSHGDSELSAIFLNGIPLDVDLDLISTNLNFNMSDRMFIQVYVRQTGNGNLPDIQLRFDDLTDSRLTLPSNAFTSQDIINIVHNNTLSDNTKVNKSGDYITGDIYSNAHLFLSDNNNYMGSYNTLNSTVTTYTFFSNNRFYNSTTQTWNYTYYPARTGGTIQMENNRLQYYTFAANSLTPVARFKVDDTGYTINSLSGTGNAYVCVDSTGKLYRSALVCV